METPTLPTSPLVTLDMARTNALNDAGTIANRQTTPAGAIGAFVTQPAFINVLGPGTPRRTTPPVAPQRPPTSAWSAGSAETSWCRYRGRRRKAHPLPEERCIVERVAPRVGEPVLIDGIELWPYVCIAAISRPGPMMFMTRVRL
jgi:hypothetical protein